MRLQSSVAGYVSGRLVLLQKLAVWYIDIPELQAVLELLESKGEGDAQGGGDHRRWMPAAQSTCMQDDEEAQRLEVLGLRLRLAQDFRVGFVGLGGSGMGGAPEDAAQCSVLQALEEVSALTDEHVRAHVRARRLEALVRPLTDLLSARKVADVERELAS